MKLAELAAAIDAEVVGNPDIDITSVSTLEAAGAGQISFLHNAKYQEKLKTTKASAVIVGKNINADGLTLLRAKDPYYAFRNAVVRLHGYRQHPHAGIHPKAHVEPSATIGEGTVVYPGAYVGHGAKVGSDCILYPNVCVYDHCVLGDRVILHAGTCIGQDGFGYATHGGEHHKIPQMGNVVIEDDVEIGANTVISRSALESTRVGKGTKIDSLVMIGHGSTIGQHCLLVAQVGIAGSVTVGNYVTMAGQAGIAGHLTIGNQATIAAQSGVMTDIDEKAIIIGSPGMPASHARKVYLHFTQLPELAQRIKALEQKAEEGAAE